MRELVGCVLLLCCCCEVAGCECCCVVAGSFPFEAAGFLPREVVCVEDIFCLETGAGSESRIVAFAIFCCTVTCGE